MRSIETQFNRKIWMLVAVVAFNLALSRPSLAALATGKPGTEKQTPGKQAGEKPKAKPFCSWAFEVFKDQVGEVCRKDLLGRIKDPQDKIFAERVLKNWEPLKGYEVTREPGLIQLENETTGDSLQFMWISQDPWVAMIDGVIVSDESKDTSLFRRIERMLKKAEDTRVAFKLRPLNPIQLFLLSNEAYAARNNHRQWAPAFFTIGDSEKDEDEQGYTRERTGTAEQIFSRQGKDEMSLKPDGGEGDLKREGYLPAAGRYAWFGPLKSQKLVCRDNGTLEKHDAEINGKKVTIRARGRHTFLVTDYPAEGKSLVIDMKPESGTVDKDEFYVRKLDKHGKPMFLPGTVTKRGKHGKIVHRGKPRPWMVPSVPCNGKYSRSLNSRCATVWQDLREEKDDQGNYRFPEIRDYFAEHDDLDVDQIRYGKADGLRCGRVFAGKPKKLNACLRYFRETFPRARRHYTEGEAHYRVCEKDDTAECERKEVSSRDLAKKYGDYQYSESEGKRLKSRARVDYHEAIKDDDGVPKRYKTQEALDRLCPLDGSGECKRAPGASADTREAWKYANEDDEEIYQDERADDFDQAIERRLLGEMMMGDCCMDKSGKCPKVLEANYTIKLDNTAADKGKKVE